MAEADWKRALRPLARAREATDASAESTSPSGAPAPSTPLGVQFEVREVVRRGSARWQHTSNTTVAATAESIGPLRLTVRPVMPGRSGGWVGANLAWTGLQYQVHQLGLGPAQVRWFTEFAALARASTGSFLGQDGVRIALDEFGSALLWRLFDEARALGITLVAAGRDPALAVADSAEARLEAAEAPGGGLTLSPVVTIGAAEVTGQSLGALGRHGLYAVEWPPGGGPVIRLGPAPRPITAEVLRLVASDALEIPREGRDEFLADYLPALARVVPVTGIEPPHPEEPPQAASPFPEEPPQAASPFPEEPPQAASRRAAPPPGTPPPDDSPVLAGVPGLTVTAVPSDERDWLDLGFVVTVDGKQVPFAPLFEALAGGKKVLRLVDRSVLRLNQPVFARLAELIAEAEGLTEWQTGVRIHRTQVALWREVEELATESQAAREWRDTVARLTDAAPEPLPAPEGLDAELRPYQLAGYSWLAFLYDHGLGGILADDMGLGKTLQTLALIQRAARSPFSGSAAESTGGPPEPPEPPVDSAAQRANGDHGAPRTPWLVVAPASVVGNWVAEAQRFAPDLRVASVTRTQSRQTTKLAQLAAENDVIVMSYNLFRLDFDDVEDVRWAGLVLDEAQFVKNHRSRAHECAAALPAPFKLAITGTPLENNVLELWSILAIVAPGLFPSLRRFTEQYVRPLSHVRDPNTVPAGISADDARRVVERLRRRIRPFVLRRTKALVAPELPEKQEQVIRVELAPKHRRLYDQVLQRERQKLLGLAKEEFDRQRFILFRSITLLRLLALDASLVDDAYADVPSAKLDALFEQLDDVIAEGHRALVFSQFTSYLHRVEARLNDAGIAYEYLDGSTTDRQKVIARFKEGDAPVFLISLKAGGFGINLTEADYVFLLDPWWNPASEAQAVDRTHRIGQEAKVNVYRLVADGTIEDKVMKLRDEKAELFGRVLDDDGAFSETLSADDIRGLLEL
ncbi:DEAD/DEAH box helicase [Gryllotalpicola ginsengisoli]|uniref:DEAD/DEAH box helicase n=1 Tax=Gryllotalpicola ginsengisoli TaxID=444608 RepID=UPI0003B5E216|nr:DEAD/DEAH box helicase [Gryllotalpicola ginsengisoli]